MSITKRQETILEIVQQNGYMSVNKLAEMTFTSTSSIRRDLEHLQNMCFLKRTHGGASVLEEENVAIPLNLRMSKNVLEKKKIAKKASSFLEDGISVMIDGSTTASFLVPYIAKHKNIILFTNNMITAINAINYGINTHCIGGSSINNSAVLSGTQSYKIATEIYPDIFFFSSNAISKDGTISDPTPEENHLRSIIIKNAKKNVFLCDSGKFNKKSLYFLTTLNDIDAAVFDTDWKPKNTKCKII